MRHFCHYCTTGVSGAVLRGIGVQAPPRNIYGENCTAKKLCNATCECWRPLEHGQKLLKCQKMPSDVYGMQENARRPGLCSGPRWESLQRSPRPLAGGEEVAALPKNPTRLSAFQATPPNFQTPSKILVLFLVPNVPQPSLHSTQADIRETSAVCSL